MPCIRPTLGYFLLIQSEHPTKLYTAAAGKLSWLRKKLTDSVGDVWIADKDGKNAEIWIKNIAGYSIYP